MESVAALYVERINTLIRNNYERLALITSRPILLRQIEEYFNGNINNKAIITHSLNDTKDSTNTIHDLYILTKQGKVVLSTDSSKLNFDYSFLPGFQESLNGQMCVDGVHLSESDSLEFFLMAPLIRKSQVFAILLVRTNGENFERALKDYTGLGETGETTLVKRIEGGGVVFITSLRFDSLATLKRTLPNDPNYAAIRAINNIEGIQKDVLDYRGIKVLAVTRYIPQTGWGIVTKMDKSEALAPIYKLEIFVISISLIGALLLAYLSYTFGSYISRPILFLSGFAEQLKYGKFSHRVSGLPSNEIGVMGNTFNSLAKSLEDSNAEINKTLNQLKKSNKSLNDFAYTVTHDLKSPLVTVEGLINIIDKEKLKESDAQSFQICQMILEKVLFMKEMVQKVLDYAKAGSSEALEKISISTHELVKEVISNLNVPPKIEIKFSSSLPMIIYPKIPLMQVFQNLISNSIKYMDKEKGIISIECLDKGDNWELSVSDNGPGIDENDFDKIFMMLKKVTREGVEGSGIGLSTVKKIITENGGEIWVESELGKGAKFYFTIMKA
ncbi:MAG: ATP-binding protein [Cytophagaceae bacterium]